MRWLKVREKLQHINRCSTNIIKPDDDLNRKKEKFKKKCDLWDCELKFFSTHHCPSLARFLHMKCECFGEMLRPRWWRHLGCLDDYILAQRWWQTLQTNWNYFKTRCSSTTRRHGRVFVWKKNTNQFLPKGRVGSFIWFPNQTEEFYLFRIFDFLPRGSHYMEGRYIQVDCA